MSKNLSILLVGYEAAPFFKKGGLGDVMYSLPKALRRQGIDARAVVPYYHYISKIHEEKRIGEFVLDFDRKRKTIGVYEGFFPKSDRTPIYFLENKHFLGILAGGHLAIREFAFFDWAVAEFTAWLIKNNRWHPSIIHCNDVHAALIPLLLQKKTNLNIPTLLSIHNLAYQGRGSLHVLDLLKIQDEETKEIKSKKPVNQLNILGEGILHADRVATVSPTYAKEITSHAYESDPIHLFLHKREKDRKEKIEVLGILNGIDYDVWGPQEDNLIYQPFSVLDWKIGKNKNKQEFLEEFSLKDRPTFCFIGRMARQKGVDLILKIINRLMARNVNLIFLGEGNRKIEKSVEKAAKKYPKQIRAELSYSESLAHKIYVASDFIIIPSRYEPCGLIQMIAMRYATIPIASSTGGLKDSIQDGKNGFLFKKNSSKALFDVIKKALHLYTRPKEFEKMVMTAMNTDFSWSKSAILYKKLYDDMTQPK